MTRYSGMTEEQKAKRKERMSKRRADHREELIERTRKWQAEHREKYRGYIKKYKAEDLNNHGIPKSQIRHRSNKYLSSKHSKLDGYEMHHCFGYDDYRKFVYIPKTLHLKIHQLLRDNNIPADTDHWMAIRDLVNSCEQYTYISV